MHNCKVSRERFIEHLLDGTTASANDALADLQECNECRNEFEAAKQTLRLTTRMMDAAAPSDEYWAGYHKRLRQKLDAPVVVAPKSSGIWKLFTTSVRLPVPVPAALVLAVGVLLFLVVRSPAPIPPPSPMVVGVPVQVPVIQEKEVTRIVYRDRYQRPGSQRTKRISTKTDESVLARSQKDPNSGSLTGFKPLDEIKLTIIKGGTGNDK